MLEGSAQAGLFYPLLDFTAGWLATLAVEIALGQAPAAAFVESLDASRSPWMRETREARSQPGCGKCARTT
jgi:hypothetical protein